MNAVDTNVLVYSLDDLDRVKRAKAQALLRRLRKIRGQTLLLWQVAGEFLRQLRSWEDQRIITRPKSIRLLSLYRRYFPLTLPAETVLDRAVDLAGRYSLSHWDSMLIAACLEAGVDTLYTEDMGAPARFDRVQLINPFV